MRLFIAVAADDEVKAAAAETVARLRRATTGAYRWVDPRDMHTTLRFFGEMTEDKLPEVEALMRAAAAATPPFTGEYGRVGAFDTVEDARIVWIGWSRGAENLEKLAGLVGRDDPRPYAPHLTLGRRRKEAPAPEIIAALAAEPPLALERPVTKLSLYASRPAPFGLAYEILAEAELGVRPDA